MDYTISTCAASKSLIGPPELYNPKPSDVNQFTGNTGNPFVDSVEQTFNSTTIPLNTVQNQPVFPQYSLGGWYSHPYPVQYTGPTLLQTAGNPCIDFFFKIVPNTMPETIQQLLEKSWAHNPLTTLKLICNLRGIRGTGKSDKEGYYAAALWLHGHHPKTLACNIPQLAEFGYFKDLPEILYRLLEGANVRANAKSAWLARKGSYTKVKIRGFKVGMRGRGRGRGGGFKARFKRCGGNRFGVVGGVQRPFSSKRKRFSYVSKRSKEAWALVMLKRGQVEKRKASKLREEKKVSMAKKAVARYGRDPDYRFLFERVSDFFADRLKADLQLLSLGRLREISLAAKWCPSLNSSFDKATLLCESVGRKVFPREVYREYDGVEDAHYAYRVRDRLRKEVLVPLRKVLQLPEVYMGAKKWGEIPYNRVPSIAMSNYKDKFTKHDTKRFEEYLEKVKAGKATIAAGTLLPHQIIGALDDGDAGLVAEVQWKRMVSDFSKNGKLQNCIAVCDVSRNMAGTPMEVAVALGVLVSELSAEPWRGKIITFSDKPKLQKVDGDDLRTKVDFVLDMEYGQNADFQRVFDLILQVAVNANLQADQMIKRIFVFTGLQFGQASKNRWETDYQAIFRKFVERGYGSCVPQIVFWNLKESQAAPVVANQTGVALVSGYSKNLMKVFLEDDGNLTPETVMEAAIAGDEYKRLEVVD